MDSRYSCLKYGFQTKGGAVATGEVPTHDAVIGNGSGKTEFVPPLHAGVLLVRYVCSEADDMPIVKSFESMTKQGRHADRQVVRIDDEAVSDATCRYDQRCLCGRARWADAWVGRVGAATHAEQEPPDPSNARKRQKQSLHSVNDWATESIG